MSDFKLSDQGANADLAYLKRLAQSGRGEPAPFLLLMAVFGLGYGLAVLLIWRGLMVEPPRPGKPLGLLVEIGNWGIMASHAAFLATVLWTCWRTLGPRRRPLNRAASAVWSAAFIGLIVVLVGIRLFARNEPPSDAVYSVHFVGPVLLVLWGCAWFVTAMVTERRWLVVVAVGSFVASLAMAWTQNTPAVLPVGAASLLLLAFVPALVLMLKRQA